MDFCQLGSFKTSSNVSKDLLIRVFFLECLNFEKVHNCWILSKKNDHRNLLLLTPPPQLQLRCVLSKSDSRLVILRYKYLESGQRYYGPCALEISFKLYCYLVTSGPYQSEAMALRTSSSTSCFLVSLSLNSTIRTSHVGNLRSTSSSQFIEVRSWDSLLDPWQFGQW